MYNGEAAWEKVTEQPLFLSQAMFRTVKAQRLSDGIVRQIREAIFSGQLRPGNKLPTERDMAERFQTSRNSVREALRRVEQEGLIRIKKGINGGVFIAEVDHRPAFTSLQTLMQLRKVSVHDITEVRLTFEPQTARLAAERASAEDIRELEEVVERMSKAVTSHELPRSYDLMFHQIVARAAGNPVLQLLGETMLEVASRTITELHPSEDTIRHVLRCHRQVLAAIRRRDGALAERVMREHIVDVQTRLARHARSQRRRTSAGADALAAGVDGS